MWRFAWVVAVAVGCRTSELDVGEVVGNITLPDADPAEGALITVAGRADVSDASGAFVVLDVPFGEHALTVLLDGYAPHTETLTVNSLTGAVVDVALVPLGGDVNRPPLVSALSVAPPQLLPGGTANVLVTAADPDGDDLVYTWSADEGFTVVAGTTPGTAVLTAPATEGTTGTLTVEVSDPDGAVGTASVFVTTVQAASNRAPVIATLDAAPPLLARGGTGTASVSALDPDGDTLDYTWTVDGGFGVSPSGDTATITAPDAHDAEGVLTVVVSDGRGLEAEASLRLTTAANRVPVIGALSVSPPTVAPQATATALVSAVDADGDALSVTWTASGGFTATATGATSATVTAPATFGASGTLLVEVSDGIDTATATVLLSTPTGRPPVLGSLSLAPPQLAPGGTSAARATASDPDGGTLTWTWSATGGFTVAAGAAGQATVTAPGTSGASGTLTATATDAQGNAASSTIGVTTTANGGPVISALSVAPSILAPGGTAAALTTATDPDGDALTVTWSATGGFTAAAAGPTTATITAPAGAAAAGTVTATVSDGTRTSVATVAVGTAVNAPPVLASLAVSQTQLAPSATAQALAVASDPEGGAISWSWAATGGFTVTPGVGGAATITAPATPGVAGSVTVTATDPGGASATATALVQTVTAVNGPPQIATVSVSPPVIAPLGTASVLVAASDPNGDALGYAFSVTGGFSVAGSGATATVTAPAGNAASGTLTVVVTDGNGGSTTAAVLVRTTDRVNAAPILQSLTATPPVVPKNTALTLTAAAVDPNGDPLTWTWQVPSGWTATGTGASISLTAPNSAGVNGTVTATVSDGNGGTASGAIVVSTWPNRAPVIANLSVLPAEFDPGEDGFARVSASDADGDVLTYVWAGVPAGWSIVARANPWEADVVAPGLTATEGSVRVTVTDGFGGQAVAEVAVRTTGCASGGVAVDGRCVPCGQDAVSDRSPVVYWRLGEASGTAAADHSGNGFHGTWLASTTRGSPTLVSNGDKGGTFVDSLTSGVVSAGAVTWPGTSAFGVSLWVRTTDTGSGLVSYASAGSDNDFLLFGPENLTLWVRNASVATGVALHDGKLHHVVYTWRSSDGTVNLWVDGLIRYSGTLQVGASLTSGGRLVLGQDQDTVGGGFELGQAFSGDLDDVAVFATFLDDAAVADLFHGQVCEACDGQDNDNDGAVDEVVLGMDPSCAAISCKAIQTGSSRGSGEWWIDPRLGNTVGPRQLRCDMSVTPAWTVVPQTKYFPFAIYSEGDTTERYAYGVPDTFLTALKARSIEGSQAWTCATVGVYQQPYQSNWVVFNDGTTNQFPACQSTDNASTVRSSGTVTVLSQLPAREWHPEDCGDWTEMCQHNFGDLFLR